MTHNNNHPVPLTPKGFINLADHMEARGRARFGADWTGREFREDTYGEKLDRDYSDGMAALPKPNMGDGSPEAVIGAYHKHLLDRQPVMFAYGDALGEQQDHGKRRGAIETETRQALEAGDVAALTIGDDGERVAVPRPYWATAGGGESIRSGSHDGTPVFVTMAVEDIPAVESQPATAAGKENCERWLAEQVQHGRRRLTKRGYFAEAHGLFGISCRCFDRLWSAAVPDTWKNPGRLPKI